MQLLETIVDWERFAQAKAHLGSNFLRVVGYFQQDGKQSIDAIENALRARNAVAMIAPADVLKNDALQLGAISVAELAEDVEFAARDCLEWHQAPDTLVEPIMQLREAFAGTLAQLEREVNPLSNRQAV